MRAWLGLGVGVGVGLGVELGVVRGRRSDANLARRFDRGLRGGEQQHVEPVHVARAELLALTLTLTLALTLTY